jgi:hypothetical protein
MTLKAKAELHGHPDLSFRARIDPIEADLRCEGAFNLATSPIRARVGVVPVTMRIPFLRRRHGAVQAMAIGPFEVEIDPFEAKLKIVECLAKAKIGKDALQVEATGVGACGLDINLSAEVPPKAFGAALKTALETPEE